MSSEMTAERLAQIQEMADLIYIRDTQAGNLLYESHQCNP